MDQFEEGTEWRKQLTLGPKKEPVLPLLLEISFTDYDENGEKMYSTKVDVDSWLKEMEVDQEYR